MQVIDAAVPGTAQAFIKTELLDKLGITAFDWRTDTSGLPTAGAGSSMTSRNMVKWGLLIRQHGEWEGEQLISREFIDTAVRTIVDLSDRDFFFLTDKVTNPGYGYYFWQSDLRVDDRSYRAYMAFGGTGQLIILVDSLDLVIVTTVHRFEGSALHMIASEVLPAFIN